MKSVIALVLLALATLLPQEAAPAAKSTEDFDGHAWLKQLVGEWTYEVEATMEPGQPPLKFAGKESMKFLGEFWLIANVEGDMPGGVKMAAMLTLGYDPKTKHFPGTWIDSANNYLWNYDGTIDDAKKVLTLSAEGPGWTDPEKRMKYRDVIEYVDADTKIMRSSALGDDGKWITFATARYRRVK